ncbi:SGNH/GDSL hydrolase family protein [Rhodohalobacter sp. SW132]|uniref:SGNH/GDSL hydrolase family protein n=1 Tax=Rhodohalobacter sp. SW132 TaxID=2293433 RepID=UPI000E22029D|nr:GDSL-type esterase/lipase family protein [Rhodohalobacter sp. SW132]REL33522.1 SGNH/GDSL hydrolase family protein [Rhodohalobacter sp. SW132]
MSNFKKASEEEKEALEKYLLQFLNIEKQFPLLPGISNRAAVANLFGLTEDELSSLRDMYSKNAKEAALELLKDDDVMDWIDNLPFSPGDTIVAIGDSSTDDLQSWFEILREVLDISRPDADYRFINAGQTNDTSSQALRRLHRDVLSFEPDWVFISLGLFDATRLSIAPKRTLLPLSETWENLSTIEDAIKEVTENPVIWISPPPIIPGLLDKMELFDFDIDENDLDQIRQIITGKTGYIVDPKGKRMGSPPEAWYYLSDGINPSLSGHVNTTRAVLYTMATSEDEREGAEIRPDEEIS